MMDLIINIVISKYKLFTVFIHGDSSNAVVYDCLEEYSQAGGPDNLFSGLRSDKMHWLCRLVKQNDYCCALQLHLAADAAQTNKWPELPDENSA